MPAAMLKSYEILGRGADPVLAQITELHAPCAMSVRSMRARVRAKLLPAEFMHLLDYSIGHHYMAAPIVVDGSLVGALRFARKQDVCFDNAALAVAGALALHVSTRLTAMRAAERIEHAWQDVLTRRSFEVAELAVRGLTVAEVGRLLGISSNTVKKHLRMIYQRAHVGSRAELAMLLASTPRGFDTRAAGQRRL
jgi:DNA-binding CsgD family transcriptional regulator